MFSHTARPPPAFCFLHSPSYEKAEVFATKYNPTQIGARIRAIRTNLGYSQESFSEHLHISREHLARIEAGSRNPSIDLFIEIAEAANVSLDYLVLGQTKNNNLRTEIHSVISELIRIESLL